MSEIFISMLIVGGIGAVLAVALELADRYIANYGEVKIDINDGDRELIVEGGGNLLGSLGSEGIFIPSACGGRGSCGYCKVKIDSGGGPVLPTETSWVTEEEIGQNVRLSCQVKVREEMKIRIPEELFSIKEYKGRVELITKMTYDIKQVRIRLIDPEKIQFKSGQYMQLTVPEYGDVDEAVYRAYSISSPESDQAYLEFIIRKVPEGICTTWVHDFLKEGDEVTMVGPHGDFYLRDTDRPVIMIAGGSGLAPIKSMLQKMAKQNSDRKATFFFGANEPKDLYHVELMNQLENQLPAFSFVPALSSPESDSEWTGETGLITNVVGRMAKDVPEAEAYLCGSPGMIDACVKTLTSMGMSEDRVFYDKF